MNDQQNSDHMSQMNQNNNSLISHQELNNVDVQQQQQHHEQSPIIPVETNNDVNKDEHDDENYTAIASQAVIASAGGANANADADSDSVDDVDANNVNGIDNNNHNDNNELVDESNNNDNNNELVDENEDDDIPPELIEAFFEELENIALESKFEFCDALDNVPDIVDDESNPIIFLRYADYDPARAATALCDYWRQRVQVFGLDLAYKPMRLGTGGACEGLEQAIVKMPYHYRFLPPDDYGRTVFCSDRADVNLEEIDDDQMVLVKYGWYIFHNFYVRSVSNQKNGCVQISINRGVNCLRKSYKYFFGTCLPIKVIMVHFVHSTLMSKTALPAIKQFVNKNGTYSQNDNNNNENNNGNSISKSAIRKPVVVLHSSLKSPTILAEMKKYGLQRKNLPKSIGGTYNVKPSWVIDCEKMVNAMRNKSNRTDSKHS